VRAEPLMRQADAALRYLSEAHALAQAHDIALLAVFIPSKQSVLSGELQDRAYPDLLARAERAHIAALDLFPTFVQQEDRASLYDQRGNVLSSLDAGGVGYWELDLRDMTLQMSARGKQLFGASPTAPFTYAAMISRLAPDERQRREQLLASALRTGFYDAEYALADDARVLNVRGQVLKDSRGRPRRMIGVLLDVTDRHAAFSAVTESERRQRLLINELNHRVKNSLATVQSIAAQTSRRASDLADFREKFEARLIALSATHNALTQGGWEGASLETLLRNELSPYSHEQVRLHGPDVALSPAVALALGMVFHELATNAAKYGPLSSSSAGSVQVGWRVERDEAETRRLLLSWKEQGGPPVQAPSHRGFGSRLIDSAVRHELGGVAEMRFEPDGLRLALDIPLEDEVASLGLRS